MKRDLIEQFKRTQIIGLNKWKQWNTEELEDESDLDESYIEDLKDFNIQIDYLIENVKKI